MGNIVDASDSLNASAPTRKYLYDKLYRLTRVDTPSDGLVEDYAYSKTGDRTLKQLGAQAPQVYAYLAGTHHLGSVDGASRNYDANGNTLTRGNGPQFSYSERNRLAVVTVPNAPFANASSPGPKAIKPTTWFKYFYNGRGELVMMQQSLLLQDTSYVYDEAGHHLGKYLGSSTKSAGEEVIYLDDMPIAMTIGGVLSYLETDHLGTPRVAANPATNALQWEWDFFGNAFGDNAATSAPSGGIDVKLRYPGQYFDGESGLHYNYFRDYEPGTGRYVESDPIGLRGGINSYSYVGGAPHSAIDPRGEFEVSGYELYNGQWR
ncbi:MAG TPA: RHS repeat-associated core domain-containing protein, partial [Thermomicrobiales bacterium]|nr:RHS repeat-associated core domain-containing protein [Thermomicrobiales bacterium]